VRRAAPRAYPPIGRRGQAIAGIALGTLALVGWLTLRLP